MTHRPRTLEARRRVLTAAARFDQPFTIDDVWRAVGHGDYPNYSHVQTVLRELHLEGQLRRVRREGMTGRAAIYEWVDPVDK